MDPKSLSLRTDLSPEDIAFLAEASHRFATSLVLESTIESVAGLAVPRLADWCAIELWSGAGSLENPLVFHSDPARQSALRDELRCHRTAAGGASPLPGHDEPLLVQRTRTAADVVLLERLGAQSYMAIPLRARDHLLGILRLANESPRRAFEEHDLLIATELGLRAAIAIENAILHRRLEEAVRMRDEFLLAASHDLRTPIAVLQLHVQGLLRGSSLTQDARTRSRLKAMERQVAHMQQLTDRLLDVASWSEDELDLRLEPVDLSELVRDVAERFHDQLLWSSCSLTLAAPAPVMGRWDRERLDQVLTNLLSNAIKYGVGQPVEMRAEDLGEMARLVVRDHGIGIAPEDHERIFEKFGRPAGVAFSGMGIGLWIVRQVVTGLHGSIRVESARGQGAAFIIDLPKSMPGRASSR